LSANDFEFAIKRAKSPETKSPFAYMLSDIKSCKATDDKTVVFTLSTVDCDLLELLSYSVCMPCNKAFFENAKGKYGLTPDYLLSNGSFGVTKWVITGEFAMRMVKNEEYKGDFKPKYDAIYWNLSEQSGRAERIDKEYLDFGFCDNYTPSKKTENVSSATFFDSTMYALVLNENKIMSHSKAREAVAMSIDRSILSNELPQNYKASDLYVPECIIEKNNKVCGGLKNIKATAYQPQKAAKTLLELLNQKKNRDLSFSGNTIIYLKDDNRNIMANAVAQSLQKSISAYVNVEEIDKASEFNSRIESGDYDFAIMEFDSQDGNIFDHLQKFKVLSLANFDKKVTALSTAKTYAAKSTAVNNCIYAIKATNRVIPLCSTGHTLVYNKKYSVPQFSFDNGCIDFA
ncbi:MAG: hypothetical protein KBS41_03325, partial [Oscillospiraceae bacterium]|nr:hypothetical protein [Candidatus Equicaccousia limihippi]